MLMGTDLLRQQQKWKSTLSEIRQLMASLVQEGFSSSNMMPWRLHWDHQLYKALEHQYQMGLEALNEHLPEIRVELTYRYIVHVHVYNKIFSLCTMYEFSTCILRYMYMYNTWNLFHQVHNVHNCIYQFFFVFHRQQKLQFRPPIEEIRSKYYRDMKKFICIPLLFRGVSEASSPAETIFPGLIDKNPNSLLTVYRKVSNIY